MAQYDTAEIVSKLEGVKPFDPAENLMGAKGKPVIAELCAQNGITMAKPDPQPVMAVSSPKNEWKQVLG